MRADHLGAWGYPRETSPRLDELAGRSVVFRRAVAQANSTIPSHASILTSRYPSEVLATDLMPSLSSGNLSARPPLLTEALSDAGFATWGFVDGGNVRGVFGFDRGFDIYVDDRVGVSRQVERAQAWLEKHGDSPFFLFLHTYEIHTPYSAPDAYVAMFGDLDFRGGFKPGTAFFRKIEKEGKGFGEELHREVVARYDAGIFYTDEVIGGFLDWLGERGLLEKSLVVILSDHGEEFFEHGRVGHDQLYLDPNLRVPLIFSYPGLPPEVWENTVELNDVAPTILDLLGLPALPDARGKSLTSVLRGFSPLEPGLAYAELGWGRGQRTLITDRYQLLRDDGEKRTYVFDLQEDPKALNDLSETKQDLARYLTMALEQREEAVKRAVRKNAAAEAPPRPAPEISDRVQRELELLGYIEGP